MKKLIIILFSIIIFSGCKKKYTIDQKVEIEDVFKKKHEITTIVWYNTFFLNSDIVNYNSKDSVSENNIDSVLFVQKMQANEVVVRMDSISKILKKYE